MISSRSAAIFAAIFLGLLLWLRPIVGRMGAPVENISAPERLAGDLLPAGLPPSTAAKAPVRHLAGVASAIFDLANAERRKVGLSLLVAEPRLAEIATAHCDDMLARGFFDHVDPDGVDPAERVARGHRQWIGTSGENIWMGSGFSTADERALAQQIVRGWMGSKGHRENILRAEFTHLGVGVSIAGDELRATQLFGREWAFLESEVPPSLPRDSTPQLASRSYGGQPTAERVDLFADGRPRWGPQPIDGASLDVDPGTYRLRFYFPTASGYTIAYGPELRIAP